MNTTPVAHVLQESSLRKSNVPPRPDRSAPPARPGRSAAAARGGPRPPRTSAATGEPPHPAAPHRREDPRPPPSVHSPRPAGVARPPSIANDVPQCGQVTADRTAACGSSSMPRIRRPRTLLLVIVASVPGAVGHSRGGGGALIYPRRRTAPQHYGGAHWPSRSDASAATARDREVSVRCRREAAAGGSTQGLGAPGPEGDPTPPKGLRPTAGLASLGCAFKGDHRRDRATASGAAGADGLDWTTAGRRARRL